MKNILDKFLKNKECEYSKKWDEYKIEVNQENMETQLKTKINCMECNKEITFGASYNVECSPKCAFYHKFVCLECAEKIWNKEKK